MNYLRLFLAIFIVFSAGEIQAQLTLEEDINTEPAASWPHILVEYDDVIYFTADDGIHGDELWSHDITSNKTELVQDIRENSFGSSIESGYEFQGKIYFGARSSSSVLLHVYDPETKIITELKDGPSIKDPGQFLGYDGLLYFTARSSGNNTRLYTYNPQTGKNELVFDLNPEVPQDIIGKLFLFAGDLHFIGNDYVNGNQFWKYDAVNKTAVSLNTVATGVGTKGIGSFIEFNGKLIFSGMLSDDPAGNNSELNEYDPVTKEFRKIVEIRGGSAGSDPSDFTVLNSKLYFAAKDYIEKELHVYDPITDDVTEIEVENFDEILEVRLAGQIDGTIYFSGRSESIGREIFSYNPLDDKAKLEKDLMSGGSSSNIFEMTIVDKQLFFSGFTIETDNELLKYNTVSKTGGLVADINQKTSGSDPSDFVVFKNKLYFSAYTPELGNETWTYNPSSGKTEILIDHTPGSGFGEINHGFVFKDKLYGAVYFPGKGLELGVYDGITTEINLVADLAEGSENGSPFNFTEFKDKLYFTARTLSGDFHLHEYDPIADKVTVKVAKDVEDLYVFNNTLYCTHDNGSIGIELYRLNSTGNDIELVKDVLSGTEGSRPSSLIGFKDKLYFSGDGANFKTRLYIYDPSSDDITEISFTTTNSSLYDFEIYNDELYFNTSTGEGSELHKFNEEEQEVEMVVDLIPDGSKSSSPNALTVFNDKLYFSATTEEYGKELWVYDAETNEAQIVADIWPGPSYSEVDNITLFNDKLYFSADDGQKGNEIWSLASCINAVVSSEPEIDGGGNGSIDLAVTGGSGNYTYNWSNGATSQDISGLVAGEYDVVVKDESGCVSELTAVVGMASGLKDFKRLNVSLYPNPSRDYVTLQIGGENLYDVSFKLMNSLGQFVKPLNYEQNGQNRFHLQLNHKVTGLYHILITEGSKQIGSVQLMVD